MNIKLIILTIISVIFSLSTLSGQNMILKSGSIYNLEGKSYTKSQIVDFLSLQPEPSSAIRDYKLQNRWTKGCLNGGLIILGTTALYAGLGDPDESGDSPDLGYYLPIFYGAIASIILVPIGLLWKWSSSTSFKRARSRYNNSRTEIIGTTMQPSLNLIVSNNGVGLALRF